MKKINVITVCTLCIMLISAGTVFAKNHTGQPTDKRTQMMQELTPEQQTTLNALNKEFAEKILPLKNSFWAKNLELQALSKNPNATPELISGLVKELAEIKNQMQKEHLVFNEKLEAAGINSGYTMLGGNCPMMGSGMGMGKKHNMHGMGMGDMGMSGMDCMMMGDMGNMYHRNMDHGNMGHGSAMPNHNQHGQQKGQ